MPAASGAPGEKDVVAAVVFAGGANSNAKPDANPDVASIFARCRERLESNFVPTYLQIVDEIPKTASEKPQARLLLERFETDAEGVHSEAG